MPTPFAALQAQLNSAVIEHLSNATADFSAAGTVDGIFRKDYAESFGMVSGSTPVFESEDSAFPALSRGQGVNILGVDYLIAEIRPDGTGMTKLILEAA